MLTFAGMSLLLVRFYNVAFDKVCVVWVRLYDMQVEIGIWQIAVQFERKYQNSSYTVVVVWQRNNSSWLFWV